MKKYLLALLLLPTICFSQVKTEVNLGLDPVTGEPGHINYDTTRTLYFQGPAFVVFGDTVSFAGSSGVWSLNGTNAYFQGYAGLGTTFPRSRFEVMSNYNTTVAQDSTGILLSQSNPAIFGTYPASAPLVLEANGWNTSTSTSQKQRARIYLSGVNAAQSTMPSLHFNVSKDTTIGSDVFYTNGSAVIFNGLIQGVSCNFQGAITSVGSYLKSNNLLNYLNSSVPGQTVVGYNGNTGYFPIEPSASLAVYSNNSQGFLPPILTTAQRDSIGFTVSAVTVTNGGTGYSANFTISNAQALLNLLAPATNGYQIWGGNFFRGTAIVSGGAVTGVTITNGGYFNGAIRIILSGLGTGTGATVKATMSRILPSGLTIFCSDCTATNGHTGVMQAWNAAAATWDNFY